MNLLTDQWIPVHQDGKRQLIHLQDVLCTNSDWQLSLPRDDMEMACLQLMICLTQVIFTPQDARELMQRISRPLTAAEYLDGIAQYIEWFDLNHPETPFMQVRGVKAEKSTPIQKLFVGLPEGNNHCFFNDPGELTAVSESAAAIALFNQAIDCPSLGGGFKGGLRGNTSITTFIIGNILRHTIWNNVLHEDSIREIMPQYNKTNLNDKPVWVDPVLPKSSITASSIGLLRGLFWQPVHIELNFTSGGVCQCYGSEEAVLVSGFNKEKFVYEIIGQWIHPHSPRYWQVNKGEKEVKYVSFATIAPAWTQLTRFTIQQESDKEGQEPAAVINQYRRLNVSRLLVMMLGGYRAKKASVIQRRHELITLANGWDNYLDELKAMVDTAIEIKVALRNKLYGFAKTCGASGLPLEAEVAYYNQTESIIHTRLRHVDWREAQQVRTRMVEELTRISRSIFEDLVRPYKHEPKMIRALATARRNMEQEFNRIKGEQV
ncbi:MAG: type I-E CRISPR-associated protein Cse1/CasA [Candidatus Neomarinimicrobiota bacterium]